MSKIDEVLAEIKDLRKEMYAGFSTVNARIDGVHTRLDTVIDSVSDLRRDFASHTHD